MSILTGVGSLVDDWLEVNPKGKPPYYRHRSAALDLSRRKTPITGTCDFLMGSYAQIHNNWLAAIDVGYSKPSKENWRWKRHLELSPANTSAELKLERSIVNACGNNWSNQMPTASGLVGPTTDKRAAVDLIRRHDSTTHSMIELKVNSNNPLFAAIEILTSFSPTKRYPDHVRPFDTMVKMSRYLEFVRPQQFRHSTYFRRPTISTTDCQRTIGLMLIGSRSMRPEEKSGIRLRQISPPASRSS